MVTRREQSVILERPCYLLPPRLLWQLPACFPQHFDLIHLLFLSDNMFFQTRSFPDHSSFLFVYPIYPATLMSSGDMFQS